MIKNTLRLPSLTTFFTLLLFTAAFGQSKIHFNVQRATVAEDLEYRKEFKHYTIATFNSKSTSDMLRSQSDFDAIELEANGQTFSFELHAHDLRSPDFRLTVQDEQGRFVDLPRTPNTTYYGYTTKGDHKVRITADDNFFTALIVQANDEFYIEPATNINPAASAYQYIMYWKSDVIHPFGNSACGVVQSSHQKHQDDDTLIPAEDGRSRDLCKTVQIALVDDHQMYTFHMSSVTIVTNHNMAVINNVQTNYDTEFNPDFTFSVVQIQIFTVSDPAGWTTMNNPGDLLDNLTAWGPSNLSQHDVASLWTRRDFNGNTIGLAWVEAVCSSVRYNVLQDFTTDASFLRCLQAHELGHNFGADHDTGGGFIMSPSVSMSNTWSTQSINQINSYMGGVSCLSPCSAPAAPIANFSADDTDGCAPFTVHFTDQSQNTPTSWLWTLPGGTPSTSTQQNPTIVYNTPGSYNVTLKATNANGNNSVTKTNYINVSNGPFADFGYTQNELVVTFQNFSTGGTSYLWNFGDGDTSTQLNPTHTYDEDGTYTVTLTVNSSCGSDITMFTITLVTLPQADFDADLIEGCSPLEVEFENLSSENSNSFQWLFPGGSPPTSNAYEPTVLYEIPGTYNVTLTVTNDAGDDVHTETNFITVYPEPNAAFTYTVNALQANFNSAGSIGDTYHWNFGDGQNSTSHNPSHLYNVGGNYTVTLTISNPCGTDVQTTIIVIAAAPVSAFSSDTEEGCAPLVVHYFNQSTGTVTGINWIFQGGTPSTSTQPNPTVTYNAPGTYDVTLTVSNALGSDDIVMDNFITVFPETVSDFDFDANGVLVSFFNQSSNAVTNLWRFGDGDSSTDDSPIHHYDNDGTYTVTLISSGACGSDTSTVVVTIATFPNADFSFNQSGICAPVTVQYTNQSSPNTTSVNWTFEGGTPATSTDLNPVVTYLTAGTYNTRLIAHAPAGNDTLTWDNIVTIGEETVASFLLNTNGTAVSFENQSTAATSYFWIFGDGQTSTETDPTHDYGSFGTYTVSLITSNACNNDTTSVVVELSTVPNAFFTYDAHSGCAPVSIQFFDQSQNTPTAWDWTFTGGEPATSTLQNPVVTYSVPGNYTVTLRVENSQGADVLVLMDLINVSDVPDATFDHVISGRDVTLFYPGIDYDSLRWDFGNGQTDNSLNPTASYDANGQYLISLIVYNTCGNDTASVLVNVESTATHDPNQNLSKWQIRPNPFGDQLKIYGEPLKDGRMTVTLMDVNGQIISKQDWNYSSGPSNLSLKGDHLPQGVILVQLQDGNGPVVLKAVHQ